MCPRVLMLMRVLFRHGLRADAEIAVRVLAAGFMLDIKTTFDERVDNNDSAIGVSSAPQRGLVGAGAFVCRHGGTEFWKTSLLAWRAPKLNLETPAPPRDQQRPNSLSLLAKCAEMSRPRWRISKRLARGCSLIP